MEEKVLKINDTMTLEKAVIQISFLYLEQERLEDALAVFQTISSYRCHIKEIYEFGKKLQEKGEIDSAYETFELLMNVEEQDQYTAIAAYEMALMRESLLETPKKGDIASEILYREDVQMLSIFLERAANGGVLAAENKLKIYKCQ